MARAGLNNIASHGETAGAENGEGGKDRFYEKRLETISVAKAHSIG